MATIIDSEPTKSDTTSTETPVARRNAVIPQVLKEQKHWCRWFKGTRDKMPANLDNSAMQWSNPSNWLTFEQVCRFDKIGWFFTVDAGIVGIDFDGCRDPKTGSIDPLVLSWIKAAHTYAEVSPSKTGVKVFIKGTIPNNKAIKTTSVSWGTAGHTGIEIYAEGRYFTITGQVVDGCPSEINEAPEVLNELVTRFAPAPKQRTQRPQNTHTTHNGATPKSTRGREWSFQEWGTWVHDRFEVVEDSPDQTIDIICPWLSEHTTAGDTAKLYYGPPHTFHCFHAHCANRTWEDVREYGEPGYKEKKEHYQRRDPLIQEALRRHREAKQTSASTDHHQDVPNEQQQETEWDEVPLEDEWTFEDEQTASDEAQQDEGQATTQEPLKTRVMDAIEKEDIECLYKMADEIALLPLIEQTVLTTTIQDGMEKCKKFKWDAFKQMIREAKRAYEAALKSEETSETVYERTDSGMVYYTESDSTVWISNFTAEIKADVQTDDGAERTRTYELAAEIGSRHTSFEVKAKDFSKCEWVDEHLGARACITTGQSMKQHLVNAIKQCSEPTEQFHYAHTGWREIDGTMCFLHGNGCVSQVSQEDRIQKTDLTQLSHLWEPAYRADSQQQQYTISQVSQVSQENVQASVRLSGSLSNYMFPDENSDVRGAIQASLRFIDLTSDDITSPLYCSLWRAPLGEVDFGVHLAGQTGEGKTELCALVQQHYGAMMSAHKLPGSWESTENSLEMLLFQAKDTVVVIDDFKPKGGKVDQDRLHAKADRIFRSIGNGSARGRLTSTLEQRVERRPRCLVISTGEDVPRGQSLKARSVVLTMNERLTSGKAAKRLTCAQQDARSGLYAQAMASYIEWLAPHITAIQDKLPELISQERESLSIDGHARSSTNTANMLIGLKYFLQFAYEREAIAKEEAYAILARCKAALIRTSEEASRENTQNKPSEQWLRNLIAAITSKSAHLVDTEGKNPGLEYGWKYRNSVNDQGASDQFEGGGLQIGWIDDDNIYLDPVAAYKAAKLIGSATGDDITTLEPTLRKFLAQDGILASTDLDKSRKTITVRRRIGKLQRDVLHIKKENLFPCIPLCNMADSPVSPDSEAGESAPEAALDVSQVVDSEALESSSFLDSDLTQDIANGNPYQVTIQKDAKTAIVAKYKDRTRVSTPDGTGWVVSIGDKIGVVLDSDKTHTRFYQPYNAIPESSINGRAA